MISPGDKQQCQPEQTSKLLPNPSLRSQEQAIRLHDYKFFNYIHYLLKVKGSNHLSRGELSLFEQHILA
jgi:hypothetical protein